MGAKGHDFAVGCGLLAQAGFVEGLQKKVQRVQRVPEERLTGPVAPKVLKVLRLEGCCIALPGDELS